MRRGIVALAVAALALGPAGASGAAEQEDTQVLAHPGSYLTNYTTPVVAVETTEPLTLVNYDVERHDVVHDPAADGCPSCPVLFESDLITFGRTAVVEGIENLEPGQVYSFYCTVHEVNMRGKLVAL